MDTSDGCITNWLSSYQARAYSAEIWCAVVMRYTIGCCEDQLHKYYRAHELIIHPVASILFDEKPCRW